MRLVEVGIQRRTEGHKDLVDDFVTAVVVVAAEVAPRSLRARLPIKGFGFTEPVVLLGAWIPAAQREMRCSVKFSDLPNQFCSDAYWPSVDQVPLAFLSTFLKLLGLLPVGGGVGEDGVDRVRSGCPTQLCLRPEKMLCSSYHRRRGLGQLVEWMSPFQGSDASPELLSRSDLGTCREALLSKRI
ncbi:hypothetical protein U1Q18_029920 [Sarracenia purpurea var. burkii]